MVMTEPDPPICETDNIARAPRQRTELHQHGIKDATVCETDTTTLHPQRQIDKQSLNYVLRSGLAGGLAGCAAKTLVAPLDRVKILFQTSNPEFSTYTRRRFGVWYAARDIHREFGVAGLFKGHAATLLRIFPYAAIKFVAYEQYRALIIPKEKDEVPWKRFAAGSLAGVTSVFFTYPLEVIRVRLAFETKARSIGIRQICSEMFNETIVPHSRSSSKAIRPVGTMAGGLANFYRGFTPTLAGMFPYAGVSFLTHDWITDLLRDPRISRYTMLHDARESDTRKTRPPLYVWAELTAGGLAGMLSQTASYPLEVIRRRMQVSGAVGSGRSIGFAECIREIMRASGLRGFTVGLTIGYIKVVPMVACSFFVYERMKYYLAIN